MYSLDKFINKTDLDNKIQAKLHDILIEINKTIPLPQIAYIGLYGSQNYHLDTPESDIDCECFVFPSKEDIIFANPMWSSVQKTAYGECTIKDIRMMFNELRKVSPNILEIISTPYAIVNEQYAQIFETIYSQSNLFAHLSEYKLLKGFEGLYHRYSKKATESNKYYANTLRIIEVMDKVLKNPKWDYNDLLIPEDPAYLYWIKTEPDFQKVFRAEYFNDLCLDIEERLQEYYQNHELTFIPEIRDAINTGQETIMRVYLFFNI